MKTIEEMVKGPTGGPCMSWLDAYRTERSLYLRLCESLIAKGIDDGADLVMWRDLDYNEDQWEIADLSSVHRCRPAAAPVAQCWLIERDCDPIARPTEWPWAWSPAAELAAWRISERAALLIIADDGQAAIHLRKFRQWMGEAARRRLLRRGGEDYARTEARRALDRHRKSGDVATLKK